MSILYDLVLYELIAQARFEVVRRLGLTPADTPTAISTMLVESGMLNEYFMIQPALEVVSACVVVTGVAFAGRSKKKRRLPEFGT